VDPTPAAAVEFMPLLSVDKTIVGGVLSSSTENVTASLILNVPLVGVAVYVDFPRVPRSTSMVSVVPDFAVIVPLYMRILTAKAETGSSKIDITIISAHKLFFIS